MCGENMATWLEWRLTKYAMEKHIEVVDRLVHGRRSWASINGLGEASLEKRMDGISKGKLMDRVIAERNYL